ncbi:MAG: FHA domain-containing protein [Blastocatellia bacterium]|nr:FHA domain-containing protein [Blastocatellia bacterium]
MQCPQCGIPNRDEAKFCTKCGFVLSSAKSLKEPAVVVPKPREEEDPTFPPERPQAAVITLTDPVPSPAPTPYLEAVFTVGLRAGERVTVVDFPATIGRDPNSTLPMALNDTLASTRHAQLNFNGRNFSLRDVGSTNGTYYQGRRIKEMMISHGDTIEFGIGGPQIRFEFPAAVQTPRVVRADPPAPPAANPAREVEPAAAKQDKIPAWAKNPPPPPILAVATPDPLNAPPAISPGMYDQPNGSAVPPTLNQPPGQAASFRPNPPVFPSPPVPAGMPLAAAPPAMPAPPETATPPQSKALALVKIAAGFLFLVAGIGVSVLFRQMQILVGFMICVMLIGLALMIWGAMQFVLGPTAKKN